jgi:hypothetical protein
MADKVSIAIRIEGAISEMESASHVLAGAFDVPAPEFPRNDKDPMMLRARQLESIAGFMSAIAEGVERTFADDDDPEDDPED